MPEQMQMTVATAGYIDGTRTALIVMEDAESFEVLTRIGKRLFRVNIIQVDGTYEVDILLDKESEAQAWHKSDRILHQQVLGVNLTISK